MPSPFDVPKPDETVSPIEDEPATMLQPQPAPDPVPSAPPFQESAPQSYGVPSAPVASTPEWNPPPVPDAQWQGQQIGSNTPFQPPPAGTGQNKTLSLISMILGILGLTVCCGSFIVSGAAIVLGFMGRSKANQDPNQYGGSGMAMAGIITGIIGLIGGLLVWLFYGSLILSSGGRF